MISFFQVTRMCDTSTKGSASFLAVSQTVFRKTVWETFDSLGAWEASALGKRRSFIHCLLSLAWLKALHGRRPAFPSCPVGLCVRLPSSRARQKLRPCFYSRARRHQTTRRSPGLRSDCAELGLNSRLWVQPCHAIRLRTACDHHQGARRSGLSCRSPACH